MRRLLGLDGLRGIAVSMVIVTHAEQTVSGGYHGILAPLRWFSGDLGVHLFFVLSGFIITKILLDEFAKTRTIDLKKFYIRRTKRIFPAFYSYVFVMAILAAVGYLSINTSALWAAGLYIWNYVSLLGIPTETALNPDGTWYLGHFWTLAIEEQFYWFWPALFLFIMRKRSAIILPALIFAVPTVRIVVYLAFPATRPHLVPMLGMDSLLVGCFFAMYKDRLEITFSRILNSQVALSIFALSIFLVLPLAHEIFRGYWTATYLRTLEAGAIGVLLLALASDKPFILRPLFLSKPVQYLGMISYSLYVWQQLVIGQHSNWNLNFFEVSALSVAFGTISYYTIERLFMPRKTVAPTIA